MTSRSSHMLFQPRKSGIPDSSQFSWTNVQILFLLSLVLLATLMTLKTVEIIRRDKDWQIDLIWLFTLFQTLHWILLMCIYLILSSQFYGINIISPTTICRYWSSKQLKLPKVGQSINGSCRTLAKAWLWIPSSLKTKQPVAQRIQSLIW